MSQDTPRNVAEGLDARRGDAVGSNGVEIRSILFAMVWKEVSGWLVNSKGNALFFLLKRWSKPRCIREYPLTYRCDIKIFVISRNTHRFDQLRFAIVKIIIARTSNDDYISNDYPNVSYPNVNENNFYHLRFFYYCVMSRWSTKRFQRRIPPRLLSTSERYSVHVYIRWKDRSIRAEWASRKCRLKINIKQIWATTGREIRVEN